MRFRTSTPDHKNWVHEIAADLIALLIFGAAYLACFEDVLEDAALNPYGVAPEPSAVRMHSLRPPKFWAGKAVV